MLPATVPGFTGREAELRTLSEATRAPGSVLVITGTAGAGKTALAVHWAHQVAEGFPDGQLFVNLRGFGPASLPRPADARGIPRRAAVPADRLPATTAASVNPQRLVARKSCSSSSTTRATRRQVRPLLPGTPASLVIVTSRNQLSGLAAAEGASLLTLDVLTRHDASQMLAARLGSRATAEPAALVKIAAQCSCLPLALAVAAARAAGSPRLLPHYPGR